MEKYGIIELTTDEMMDISGGSFSPSLWGAKLLTEKVIDDVTDGFRTVAHSIAVGTIGILSEFRSIVTYIKGPI